jgi:hypothetical protein
MLVDIWVIAARPLPPGAPLLNRPVERDGSVVVEQDDGKGVFLM